MTVPGNTEAASAAPGQSTPSQESRDDLKLTRVEQTVSDVSPLAYSLRWFGGDLAQPNDFASVYEVPGRPDMLMRVQGALYAVFPRSVYVPLKSKAGRAVLQAVIPPDTVFHIGHVHLPDSSDPRWSHGSVNLARGESRARVGPENDRIMPRPNDAAIDARVRQFVGHEKQPQRASSRDHEMVQSQRNARRILLTDGPITRFIADASYRESRITALMRRARQAEKQRSQR